MESTLKYFMLSDLSREHGTFFVCGFFFFLPLHAYLHMIESAMSIDWGFANKF